MGPYPQPMEWMGTSDPFLKLFGYLEPDRSSGESTGHLKPGVAFSRTLGHLEPGDGYPAPLGHPDPRYPISRPPQPPRHEMLHPLTPLATQIQDVTSIAPLMGHKMSHSRPLGSLTHEMSHLWMLWATQTQAVPSLAPLWTIKIRTSCHHTPWAT